MMKLKSKLLSKVLIFIMFLSMFSIPVFGVEESKGITVEAGSALLIEPVTGKVLFEKNSHTKFAPASVTKIMTMLLAMEEIDSGRIKLTDKITASENAKKMGGSTMLLDTGEVRTVEEILKGIAIASGNDAAVAMAEYLSGTEDAFVNKMNERAQALGMKDTTFKNCTGLPADGHLSSAYDISVMSRELLKHPKILKYSGIYMETISEGRKSPIELVNHNKLVRFFKGCDGLKTGFTAEAKYCISATACRDGIRMLAVIMGAPTYKIRNRDASMLLNFGFSKFEGKKAVDKDGEIARIPINKSQDKFFIAKAEKELVLVIPRGSKEKIAQKLVLDENKKYYQKGEVIGVCEYYLGEDKIGEVNIYSDRDVKKGSFFENLKFNLKNLFKGGV